MTPQQQRLLDYIRDYFDQTGLTPTFEEMRGHLGLAGKSGVYRAVEALAEQGLIKRHPKAKRGIYLPQHWLASVPTKALQAEIARRERRS